MVEKTFGDKVFSVKNFLSVALLSAITMAAYLVITIVGFWWYHLYHIELFDFIYRGLNQLLYQISFIILLLIPLNKDFTRREWLWKLVTFGGLLLYFLDCTYISYGCEPDLDRTQVHFYNYITVGVITDGVLYIGAFLITIFAKYVLKSLVADMSKLRAKVLIIIILSCLVGCVSLTYSNFEVMHLDTGKTLYYIHIRTFLDHVCIGSVLFGAVWYALIAVVFLFLSLLYLHSFVWQVVCRPLYAADRFKIFSQHKTLFYIGCILIALPHGYKLTELLKEFRFF
jgi:hypothetical protein